MVAVMNEYISQIMLQYDDVTKGILSAAVSGQTNIAKYNIMVRANRYVVDISLVQFSIENAIHAMNHFMEQTRYHYSAFYIRFNEGSQVRYRFATCREDRNGFYCDVVIR